MHHDQLVRYNRSGQLVAIYGLKLKLKFDIDEKVNNQCWLNFLTYEAHQLNYMIQTSF
jgi:hypothetical protein